MKPREIRALTAEELTLKIAEKGEELANLKLQLSLRQLDNSIKVRLARRDLARLKTMLREHELGLRRLAENPSTSAPK